jgi:serine phosphatase RsbU (regulator of sigma subunit)/Tfp pilus assembly protein PilF
MLRLILIIWGFFLCCTTIAAQEADSLELEITNTGNKRKKTDLMNEWAEKNFRSNPEKALGRSIEALQLAQSIKYKRGQAAAHLTMGKTFQLLDLSDSALVHFQIALKSFRETTLDAKTAETLLQVAMVHFSESNLKAALQNANEALEIYEILEDQVAIANVHAFLCQIKSILGFKMSAIEDCRQSLVLFESLNLQKGKTGLLNSLGEIYLDMNEYQRSEEYFTRALNAAKSEQDSSAIAETFHNLGNVCLGKGENDKAIGYFSQALDMNMLIGDYHGMGGSYFYLGISASGTQHYDSAIFYFQKSMLYAQQYRDLDLQAKVNAEIGKVYLEANQEKEALEYLQNALMIARKIDAEPLLQICCYYLANYYDEIGDTEQALQYYKEYMHHKDEVYTNQSVFKIAEVEALYNLEKKDEQIQLLRSENKIKDLEASERNLMNIWLITGLIFVFTTMVIVYRQYKMQNRANQILYKQNEAIQRQKEEIVAQRNDIEKINQMITEKNNQITDSIQYAKRIQLSLLPDDELIRKNFTDSFVFFLPKDIVSGDFYWLKNSNDILCIAIIDCTGHGVPGAFMTLLANSLLNQISFEENINHSPASLLCILDEKVKQNLSQHNIESATFEGMDMGLCVINLKTRQINYAGAKIPLYYVHDGRFLQVKPDRFSVGGNEIQEKQFTNKTLSLNSGDLIYLATDGFQDQFGGRDGKKFMKLNFRDLIRQVSLEPVSRQKEILEKTFHEWKGSNQQTDDVLIMGIQV